MMKYLTKTNVLGVYGGNNTVVIDALDKIFCDLKSKGLLKIIKICNHKNIKDSTRVIADALKYGMHLFYYGTHRYYHPDLEIALVSCFKDKDFNKTNAKLIFSSLNSETMDLLRADEIYIADYKKQELTINNLTDFDLTLVKKSFKHAYQMGAFGGIPDTIDFNQQIYNKL